ncbi:MAG: hypothetical protein QXY07_04560 [Candidatus Bathyarchaeia archaeon]
MEQFKREIEQLRKEIEEELRKGLSEIQTVISKGLIEFLNLKFPQLDWRIQKEIFLRSTKLQTEFCEFMQKRGVKLVYEGGRMVLKC